jgi:type III restriction enzyme
VTLDGMVGMAERRKLAKFEIAGDELALLKRYVEFVGDDRVMLALHDTEPAKLRVLRDSMAKPGDYFKADGRSFKNTGLLVDRILDYFSIVPEDFDRLKELADEIRHFKRISVSLKDISELTRKVETVAQYQDPESIEAQLDDKLKRGKITLEEYKKGIKQAARMVREETVQYGAKQIRIKYLANHYYIPIILSGETDRISYIKHIIQERSEIEFINKLEDYVNKSDNKLNEFDWWLFSKLDESLDEVYIPYYNPKSNGIAHFKPDFIFWLQKDKNYYIAFIDPKGTAHTDYQHKIDGYREIFEDNGAVNELKYGQLKTHVFTFLYTQDENKLSRGYERYWFDNMDKVLNCITQH